MPTSLVPLRGGVLVLLASSLYGAAAPLSVVRTVVSDRDGGGAVPSSFVHDPGETMFFSFQVDGFKASSTDRVHLNYTVEAFDSHGVRIMEAIVSDIEETMAPEDKNWHPTIRHEIDSASGRFRHFQNRHLGNRRGGQSDCHQGTALRGARPSRGPQRGSGNPQHPFLPRRGRARSSFESRLPPWRCRVGPLRYHRV